jgi:hypothetical protein
MVIRLFKIRRCALLGAFILFAEEIGFGLS